MEAAQRLIPERRGDVLTKLAKIWPIIVTIVSGVTGMAIINTRVDWHTKVLKRHERRLTNVEFNAAVARVNTDALVESLLNQRQQALLKRQVDSLSSYVLKEGPKGDEE